MADENPCLTFFERHAEDPEKVKALQKEGDAVKWENWTASRFSSGPVGSEEEILRLFFQPIHIDRDSGSLKPTAVSDVSDKGFSVDRTGIRSRAESLEVGKERAARAVAEGRSARTL